MCTPAENCKKHYIFKTPYFWGSKSFKVIIVNSAKKLVTSACYDKQHVYANLQSLTLDTPISIK